MIRSITHVTMLVDDHDGATEAERERLGSRVGDHVAVVLSTDDCRGSYETLPDRGLQFAYAPEERPWGIETTFEDPYGNVFDPIERRSVG